MDTRPIIVVCGPTATGKSDLAVALALHIAGEVVSADSRQVYQELTISSGKITESEMCGVPHHMLDVVSLHALPTEHMNVAMFQKMGREKIQEIFSRHHIPIICGGTGLYIDALLQNSYAFDNPPASDHPIIWIGLTAPMPLLRERIRRRLDTRIEHGMIDEITSLVHSGISHKTLYSLGLEMRYISEYLLGNLDYATCIDILATRIGQYAKRQMTWFKRNQAIHWIDISVTSNVVDTALSIIRQTGFHIPEHPLA